MPRPHRIQIAGGVYHVTARANVGRLVFADDHERAQFLLLLERTVARRGWSCRAYCLLSTHYHLLVETPHADIAAGMQYVNGRYAQWANWSRGEGGHLFDARYHAVLVESHGHALELHRYIALNPVRAGLARRPETWPWSSLRPLLGLQRVPALLDVHSALQEFGSTRVAARRRLRAFLEDGIASDTV